ncbi:hypothetical protein LCGC14_1114630 [marine sediment metagenome]|uniref:Uncharacterized protein n=1 Tax=marine sediment metagenome TaxID=412755 RepID=A0A0F9QBN5_9ZZZZ
MIHYFRIGSGSFWRGILLYLRWQVLRWLWQCQEPDCEHYFTYSSRTSAREWHKMVHEYLSGLHTRQSLRP